jgi:hypothetical protein
MPWNLRHKTEAFVRVAKRDNIHRGCTLQTMPANEFQHPGADARLSIIPEDIREPGAGVACRD